MIRQIAALLVMFVSAAVCAQAQTSAPLVRTALNPIDGIVIGQPVHLSVDVLFPDAMVRPPLVKLGEAPGAQIMRFESQATTIRDTIAGQNYVGQSFDFVVFPRRGGAFDVPAPVVTLLDKAGDPVGTLQGQPTHFSATAPVGIDPSGPVLAASRVSVEQTWSPDPASAHIKAGGAITRTITRRAAGVPALGMAEFRFAAPDGVRVYVDPPEVNDKVARGVVDGSRTDKVTYVFERPGDYALPALSQPWWDIDARQARSATLSGATISVSAAGQGRAGWRTMVRDHGWMLAVTGGGILLLAAIVPVLVSRMRHRRTLYRESPAFARKKLLDAARAGDLAATWRAFAVWIGCLSPDARIALEGDAQMRMLRARLDRALFGQGLWSPDDGERFAAAIESFPVSRFDTADPARAPLPPLNPLPVRQT